MEAGVGEAAVVTVAAVCTCGREFLAPQEQDAWRQLQGHIEEFAQVDDTLHALLEFARRDRLGIPKLSLDEVIATHAADIERQWRLGMVDDPNVEPFEVWAKHVTEYLSLIVHKEHAAVDWEVCSNPACMWARAVVRHG